MRVMEATAMFLWKDVSESFTAREMNDYSSFGRDTKLCGAGDDGLPVLRACFTCSSVFMPRGSTVFLFVCSLLFYFLIRVSCLIFQKHLFIIFFIEKPLAFFAVLPIPVEVA